MDIFAILSSIKGKVLDAAYFDLLSSAYELQNQNVEQLKNNNEAVRENNQLLRERCERMETDIGRLKAQNAELAAGKPSATDYKPTGLPLKILKLYRQVDDHLLFDKRVASVLPNTKLEIEVAFLELSENNIVSLGIMGERGAGYFLTNCGKKLVLQIEP